jgi:cell division protein FtsW (lipid II flippase)
MLKAFAAPQQRHVTLIFLAVFCLAAIALVLAFVQPWRRARAFKYLSYASGMGFGVLESSRI